MSQLNISSFSSLSSSSSASSSSRTDAAPSAADTDRFTRALEGDRRHDMDSGGSQQEGGNGNDEAGASQTSFSSLFSMSSPLDSLFAGKAEAAAPAAQLAEADLDTLVERILVSTPESGGHEVRISLGDSVLRGTEIILQRGLDGMLSVSLNTTDAASFQTLVSAQNELKRMLETRENGDVRVEVSRDNGHDGNDADRESRGKQDYDTFA